MLTKTMEVAKEVQKRTGKGETIWNDRLVDGRRSLKVWGWGKEEYALAEELLKQRGCKVFSHIFQSPRRRSMRRLHVDEFPTA